MPTNPRQIADALAEEMRDHDWDVEGITVERKNWAQVELEEMSAPVVFVVPGGVDVSRIGRKDWQVDNVVTVFVGRHCQTDAEVDGMYDLTDEIAAFIRANTLEEFTTPQTVSVEINPDDALTERNAWRAVITATYRTFASDA